MSEYQYLVNMVPPAPIHCSNDQKFGNVVISGNKAYVSNLSEINLSGLDMYTPDLIVQGVTDLNVLSVSTLCLRSQNVCYGMSVSLLNMNVSNTPINRNLSNTSLLSNSLYLLDLHHVSFNVPEKLHYIMCVMP
jgi:hypothetical protein